MFQTSPASNDICKMSKMSNKSSLNLEVLSNYISFVTLIQTGLMEASPASRHRYSSFLSLFTMAYVLCLRENTQLYMLPSD